MSATVRTIGDATLYCGDCLDILPTLGTMDIIVADPPYSSGGAFRSDRCRDTNLKYVRSERQNIYPVFDGDNRDQRSFIIWCDIWMRNCLNVLSGGGIILCFIDWRNLPCIIDAIQVSGFIYRGIVPWNKTSSCRPQKGCFKSQCEYVIWGTKGPNIGEKIVPGFFEMPVERGDTKVHPAQKPVTLIKNLLELRREPGTTVFDPFMGSGNTGIAALESGMKFVGIEKSRDYFDVACRRIERAYQETSLLRVGREEPSPQPLTLCGGEV